MKHLKLLFAATVLFASTTGLASDKANLCIFDPLPSSANIDIAVDEGLHSPNLWNGDPAKVNWDAIYGWGALESMFALFEWDLYSQGSTAGKAAGFVMPAAVFIQSPFTGEMDWVRAVISGILAPDGTYHHHLFFAPGEFAACEGCTDLQIGGPNETAILEVMDDWSLAPVDPSFPLLEVYTKGGSEHWRYNTPDGAVSMEVWNENLKSVTYPFDDGHDPRWGYYWIRPLQYSVGQVSLGNHDYWATGTSWYEREWGFSVPFLATQTEYHFTINIDGCLNAAGKKKLCKHSGTTILGFDIRNASDLSIVTHDWHEVGAPPSCQVTKLGPGEWEVTPLETYISPITGYTYATKARVTAPSRGVDLVFTVDVPQQEVFKTAFLWAGWYEPKVRMEGVYKGVRVYGEASLEEFNGRTNRELGIPIPTLP